MLDDATALESAFANDSFGENITETTSAIAAANNAILAINGDYYGFRDTGIVLRNGVVFRDDGARQGWPSTATAPSRCTTKPPPPLRS